ncbi:MAG: hypothetical protein PHH38_07875 [Candidatus Cloacimonetes bacterium]|nr:hypothetical protein [Candidatus Cloacimonadota bacterium]
MPTRDTVVTACDQNFVWGAMLLGISLRYHSMTCAYHILGYDLTQRDVKCLQSIPGTEVFPVHKTDMRSVCTQKPMAIDTAETDIVVWMDADCVVSGNLEKFFVCPDNKLQIRIREENENFSVYRNLYTKHDTLGKIPQKVLDIWQKDVNDLDEPGIQTVYQTNCFVLNKTHLSFVELWKQQMLKVIPENTFGVYNKKSVAYSMTDESVINSLFAFSSQAPATSEYLMDKDPNAACIHFGLSPKPWQHWTFSALRYYDYVQKLIAWANTEKYRLPALTTSLMPQRYKQERRNALTRYRLKTTRYLISTHLRKITRLVRS